MKKYILPIILLVSSIFFVTIIWEFIKIPYDVSMQIEGESYLKNLHNPLNDSLRFIIFLGVPFLSIIFFFQITEKKLLITLKIFLSLITIVSKLKIKY